MMELVKNSTLVEAASLLNVDCSVSFVKEVGDFAVVSLLKDNERFAL